MGFIDNYTDWKLAQTQMFWGEIAPHDHVLQIYEDDENFVNVLSGFMGTGINSGDCVIVIATRLHLLALERKLVALGIHVDRLMEADQYISLEAEACLSKFMLDGWPDEILFMDFVKDLVDRGKKTGRKIRVFGEMVAVMWGKGYNSATIQLEHLWNKFIQKESLSLFCAYPKSAFVEGTQESVNTICCSHSKMISVSQKKPMAEIYFRTLDKKQAELAPVPKD